jgi:ribose transport system substrate-binding protein
MEARTLRSPFTYATAIVVVATVFGAGLARPAWSHNLVGAVGLASDPYWISLMCGGTKAAEAAGSRIDWYAVNNGSDAAENMASYEALRIANPDGIVMSLLSTEPPPGYAQELMAKGVPVVFVGGLPATDRNYLAGFRSAPADDKMGEVADMIIADTGGTGQMAVLGGIAGLSPVLDARWQVLTRVLAKAAPQLEILPTQYDQFDVNKANEIVSSLIVANPGLKAVYTVSGPEGQGAVAAIQAAGLSGKILVYSFDAVPALQQAVREGTVRALIAQPARLLGAEVVKRVIAYLDTHTQRQPVTPDVASQDVQLDTMVITRTNIDSSAAQEYLYRADCK